MTAEAAAFTRTWRAGRYTVQLTAPRPKPGQAQSAVIEWSPRLPRKLTPAESAEYRTGRDAALLELSKALGIPVVVVG
jgi:hypothetical protein